MLEGCGLMQTMDEGCGLQDLQLPFLPHPQALQETEVAGMELGVVAVVGVAVLTTGLTGLGSPEEGSPINLCFDPFHFSNQM